MRNSKIGADKRLKSEANAGHLYVHTPAAAATTPGTFYHTLAYFFMQIPSHFSGMPEFFATYANFPLK